MFWLLCFVYMVIIETQNRRPNNIQKTSEQSYKTQITVESRFLEPPGETQIGSRNREFEKSKVASNYT